MAVTLDVVNAQHRHRGCVLQERHRPDIGQVFAADDVGPLGISAAVVFDQASVGNKRYLSQIRL